MFIKAMINKTVAHEPKTRVLYVQDYSLFIYSCPVNNAKKKSYSLPTSICTSAALKAWSSNDCEGGKDLKKKQEMSELVVDRDCALE